MHMAHTREHRWVPVARPLSPHPQALPRLPGTLPSCLPWCGGWRPCARLALPVPVEPTQCSLWCSLGTRTCMWPAPQGPVSGKSCQSLAVSCHMRDSPYGTRSSNWNSWVTKQVESHADGHPIFCHSRTCLGRRPPCLSCLRCTGLRTTFLRTTGRQRPRPPACELRPCLQEAGK